MVRRALLGMVVGLCAAAPAVAGPAPDTTKHTIEQVDVAEDVALEVLDWGGQGPPLIFLAGYGSTAHAFDDFAPRFTDRHHVYGITRRGFGDSSKPAPTPQNFDPDRLGDDVLAVINKLRLKRPVLVGHSIAGQELSSVGTRHPEAISGLVYLDAAYGYAFYDRSAQSSVNNLAEAARKLQRLPAAEPSEARGIVADLLAILPDVQRELSGYVLAMEGDPDQPEAARTSYLRQVQNAVFFGVRKYRDVRSPTLAVFAVPPPCGSSCDQPRAKARETSNIAQVDAFAAHYPQARVVRLPRANHFVWRSNGVDVEREIRSFLVAVEQLASRR